MAQIETFDIQDTSQVKNFLRKARKKITSQNKFVMSVVVVIAGLAILTPLTNKDLMVWMLRADTPSVAVMPLISRNVPAYGSPGGNVASTANDDNYDSAWRGSIGGGAWVAYDLSKVSSLQKKRVLAVYYNGSYSYNTLHGAHYNNLGAYTIEGNTAPGGTPPTDGWTNITTVANNTLHSRQHELGDISAYNWVRIKVTASDGSFQNTDANFNQFDLYDISTSGPSDNWIFYGDSVTAGGMSTYPTTDAWPGQGTKTTGSFAELIHAAQPARWPVQENGGEPFDKSSEAVKHLIGSFSASAGTGYLSIFPGKYVVLAYGLNDAAGAGGEAQFYANMETMVKAVLALGKTPIIPKINYTNVSGHNANIPAYNAKIDQLYAAYPQIIKGPDFWAYFQQRTDLIGPGDIHPTPAGYAAMRQQWAQTMLATVYSGTTPPLPTVAPPQTVSGSLKAVGNKLVDENNKQVRLLGVNHSGGEYACVGGSSQDAKGYGIMEGPQSGVELAQGIKQWKGVNTVRIGMNEGCWGAPTVNGVAKNYLNLDPRYSGASYQNFFKQYVTEITSQGLYVVLELHWSAPGDAAKSAAMTGQSAINYFVPHGQSPMLNREHSLEFWKEVATMFKGNGRVIFDLHNEPYPHWNQENDLGWQCWRDGSDINDPNNTTHCIGSEWWDVEGNKVLNGGKGITYPVAGMQEVVNTVRSTGATNVIMLGGLQYANDLKQWLKYKPVDPLNNLVASWHVYPFNLCNSATCWEEQIAPVAAQVPLVAGEIGQPDCQNNFVEPLMSWLDGKNAGYLAWTWNQWGCGGMQLMNDYSGVTATAYGQGIRDHIARFVDQILPTVSLPPVTPTPTRVVTSTPIPTSIQLPTSTPTIPPTSSTDVVVYTDSLSSNWVNWSWSSAVDLANTQHPYSGSRAIKWTGNTGGGLKLHASSPLSVRGYLRFALRLESPNQKLSLQLRDASSNAVGKSVSLANYSALPANQWLIVSIPMSDLGAVGVPFTELVIINNSQGNASTYYLDDIRFIQSAAPLPTATPTRIPTSIPTPTPTRVVIPVSPTQIPTPTPTIPPVSGNILKLYENSVESAFIDNSYSYSSRNTCDSSAYVSASCSYAIAFNGWGGLQFISRTGNISPTQYSVLEFKLKTNGQPLSNFNILFTDSAGGWINEMNMSAANTQNLANGWVLVSMPLSRINPANKPYSNIHLKNGLSTPISSVNFEDVLLK